MTSTRISKSDFIHPFSERRKFTRTMKYEKIMNNPHHQSSDASPSYPQMTCIMQAS
jgi:hypothetical protein